MTDSRKKKEIDYAANSEGQAKDRSTQISGPRHMKKISPLGMRVVVQLRREANMTDAGLYLPEGAKQAMAESLLAQVLEVASAIDQHTDEEANISGVPLGALVLVPKTRG